MSTSAPSSRDETLRQLAAEVGLDIDTPFRAVPRYEVAVLHAETLYISGQIPRVGDQLAVCGRAGEVSLEDARRAARICVLRALAIARQQIGSLDRLVRVLRMNVFVQSAADFTQQSEVADAASDILYALLAPDGGHTRTSVGVAQLPKDATVEIDLTAAVRPSVA
ncbi:RidA family protein [Niveibacterium umoris]|uniref:Enamine deaminase RidA (YjgF/YER057c/UK114 family) n=1 Tax=Niveibacterium umoris TaxID=1193620 RepID=A0A840BKS7_9RHOO|nr:RidA family protein [Niveibacterium umoris]MBB4013590.1 enamine deaminase RidA (YjgF/YER057c/UK114 family) [Niveibacterium umoris]